MFNWFRNSKALETVPENPGKGTSINCGFSNGERSWSEDADLLDQLSAVMHAAGHKVRKHKSWVTADDQFILLPRFVNLQPLEPKGVRTCTTIEVRHTKIIPPGVFEYQHSTGDDLAQSLSKGFETWREIDFAVLRDCTLQRPEKSLLIEMSIPMDDSTSKNFRRAVLGPVSWFSNVPKTETPDEHPPFCSCCLYTSLSEELKDLIKGQDFLAVRFFASRDAAGQAQVDCRINGIDWEPGKEALIRYVQSWAGEGFEFRKQYGILHSARGPFSIVSEDASHSTD